MAKVHYVSFYNTGGSKETYEGRNYESRMKTNIKLVESSGYFDTITAYNEKKLDEDFWEKNKDFILSNKRGYGYWIWKPQIIYQKLQEVEDGDIVVYADAGSSIIPNRRNLFEQNVEICDRDEIVFSAGKSIWKENMWTKAEIFEKFDPEGKIDKDSVHNIATYMMVKKTNKMIQFVKSWIEACEIYDLVNDKLTMTQDKSFIENRHDQSMFSILCKINGYKPVLKHCEEFFIKDSKIHK